MVVDAEGGIGETRDGVASDVDAAFVKEARRRRDERRAANEAARCWRAVGDGREPGAQRAAAVRAAAERARQSALRAGLRLGRRCGRERGRRRPCRRGRGGNERPRAVEITQIQGVAERLVRDERARRSVRRRREVACEPVYCAFVDEVAVEPARA